MSGWSLYIDVNNDLWQRLEHLRTDQGHMARSDHAIAAPLLWTDPQSTMLQHNAARLAFSKLPSSCYVAGMKPILWMRNPRLRKLQLLRS